MKIYKLTKEGRRVAKIPGPDRTEVLDYLYVNKTASDEELLSLDKEARSKLREFLRRGYVEEITP